MSGDTFTYQHGSTINIEGQFLKDDGTPFSITDAQLTIHETLNINNSEISATTIDAAQGTFSVSITDLESQKLPQGRNAWFKLKLHYPDVDQQNLVFPPIWIDGE